MLGSLSSEDSNQPKILDEVRQYLCHHHYSNHTERSYVDWIVRFIRFHRMRSQEDLLLGEPKIEAFLTYLAVEGNVATATRNQAMNALVFLYKRLLRQTMEAPINAVSPSAGPAIWSRGFTQKGWEYRPGSGCSRTNDGACVLHDTTLGRPQNRNPNGQSIEAEITLTGYYDGLKKASRLIEVAS